MLPSRASARWTMSSGADPTERLVLDTSGYSHLQRGHAQVLDWLAAATVIFVPATVVGELEAAFRQGTRQPENRRLLDEFLAEPFVDVLVTDRSVGRRYGTLATELRRTGTPIPTNDIWIAAATLSIDGRLLTFDRDFERVPGLDRVVLS